MVRIALGLRRFVRAGWRRRSVVGRGPVPGGLFRGGEGIHGVRSHPYGKGLTSTARDSHRGPARTADPVRRTKALTRTGPPSAVRRPRNPHRNRPAVGPHPSCEAPRAPGRALDARQPALRAEPSIRGARAPGETLDRGNPAPGRSPGPGGIPASERSSLGSGIPASERKPGPGEPNARTKTWTRETRRPDKTLNRETQRPNETPAGEIPAPGQVLRPREPSLAKPPPGETR
jgi:hypothetical protein